MGAGLFGINKSNRDLEDRQSWGKNQFNNNFPIALVNYMSSKDMTPVFIKLNQDMNVYHSHIGIIDLFGLDYTDDRLYFNFESPYIGYQRFTKGNIPRADITTMLLAQNNDEDKVLKSLEIKLTAIPDHQTFNLGEDEYSSELVIRPDTIVYLAFSLLENWLGKEDAMYAIFEEVDSKINDFSDGKVVQEHFDLILSALDEFLMRTLDRQQPLILQPIWKTIGKTPKLADNCLDVFVWSDHAFTRLFVDYSRVRGNNLNRLNRSCVWLFCMLLEYSKKGKVDHKKIIDNVTYNTKNDKAFALSGLRTHAYLSSKYLIKPRVRIDEIQNIILGGGEKHLSPERRFDSAIVSAPGLFDKENSNE